MIQKFDISIEKHRDLCPTCGSNYNNFKGPLKEWKNNNCNCYQQNKLWKDYSLINIPRQFYSKDFSDYEFIDDEENKGYFINIKKYIENIDAVYESGSNLFLYSGASSTGKTFFATCILKEAYRKNYITYFVPFVHIYNEISNSRDFGNYLKKLCSYDFLVIDSIDKIIKTVFLSDLKVLNFLEELLKTRYKPTIFTSQESINADLETLKIVKRSLKEKVFELHIDHAKAYNKNDYWDRLLETKKEIIK